MKKWCIAIISCLFLFLMGCGGNEANNELTGNNPPEASIQIDGETYETTLGTYCWSSKGKSECVDTAGPKELLEGKQPIQVKPGAEIKFVMDYKPLPNEVHVTQFDDSSENEVNVEGNSFTAPTEKGTYYYSYGVWWMDEEKENVSNGDAFYAFAIEVK
ncbi:hypothetical protein [Fredinandcohnia sp. 179-A 10B2 NHS]|uniref:hypothetical protein n=1 Tax=Fredinandcohnia sp. 179-A 10B2 NHS TaxID=3235176 RepID=UPI0039A0C072